MKKLLFLIIPLLFVLTGCSSEINQPITPESAGLWNQIMIWFSQILIGISRIFGNYLVMGIIITTLLLRIIMIPLYNKQFKSTRETALVQADIKKLKAKYEGKPGGKEKIQQETMAIYKRHGVNPLAGCLPMLLQLPILIAFYDTIMRLLVGSCNVESASTCQTGLEAFGASDLITTQIISGASLAEVSIFFTVTAAVATYIAAVIQRKSNPETANDQTQKMMVFMGPAMIGIFGLMMPAALTIYWAVSNLFTVGQNLVFAKMHKNHTTKAAENDAKNAEKLEEAEVKVKKPSTAKKKMVKAPAQKPTKKASNKE